MTSQSICFLSLGDSCFCRYRNIVTLWILKASKNFRSLRLFAEAPVGPEERPLRTRRIPLQSRREKTLARKFPRRRQHGGCFGQAGIAAGSRGRGRNPAAADDAAVDRAP